ncbi:hypothetical protein F8388_010260 [Cannabis sativa]|uniref:Uncharacterized protein n=1 Tax=Cannabis sativa TaxID=3483 RepID=A0A7J6GRY9_CANSA|nr:hypothetical protein F8388_010260 [Cannabis sativa]
MVDMMKENKLLAAEEHIATLPISDFMILSSTRRLAIVGSATNDSACPTTGRMLVSSGFILSMRDGLVCTPMRKKYKINPMDENISSIRRPLRGKKLDMNNELWPRTDGPSSRPPWASIIEKSRIKSNHGKKKKKD